MKIAIFNDFQLPLPPVKGGSVPHLTYLILKQNEIAHDFDIDVYSCCHHLAKKESKDFKYSRFIYIKEASAFRFLTNLLFKLKLIRFVPSVPLPPSARRIFRKNKYDLVYVNGYIRGALSIIKQTQSPTIVHTHVVTDIIHEPTIRGREIVEKASRLLFVSDFATKAAQTGSNEQNQKMITFPNVIDLERFQCIDRNDARNFVRSKYGIRESDTLIIFVGRMVQTKGALELIEAFVSCGFDDSVKLMIVGGSTYSSNKASSYVRQCTELANKFSNIIMTGYISYDDIPRYYLASDISTLLSLWDEPAGLVGIESMAAGLPLITTNRGGIPEYVTPECKIEVQEGAGFVDRVKEAILKLVNHPEERQAMSEAGRLRAASFSRSTYYETFKSIINNVLENKI